MTTIQTAVRLSRRERTMLAGLVAVREARQSAVIRAALELLWRDEDARQHSAVNAGERKRCPLCGYQKGDALPSPTPPTPEK